MEFFVSTDQLPLLINRLKTQFPNYTYNAINHSGSAYFHSSITKPKSKSKCRRRSKLDDNKDDEDEGEEEEEEEPNTVTWGVFPNHEIVQPTIVERSSFLAWKDEAFALWDQWAQCFDVASETEEAEKDSTRRLMDEVREGWFLMNVVNNDYHEPQGVFELFEEDFVIARAEKEAKSVVETEKDLIKVEKAADPKVVVVEVATRKAEEKEKEKVGEDAFSSALAAAVVAATAAAGGSVCQRLVAGTVAVSEANCTA